MAVTAQLSPAVFLGSLGMSNVSNALDWGVEMDTQDVTTWATVPFPQYVGGLKKMSFSTTHFQDYAAAAVESWIRANYGSNQAASLAYNGEATGNACVIGRGLVGGYRAVNVAVGAVPTNVVELQGSGTVVAEGQVTQTTAAALTVTANTTPVQVGASTAAQSTYAAIHLTAVSGTTPTATFQLQSSTTSGGSYTNRGSASSAQSAAGWVWLSAAGAVTDTWWRLAVTITGTTPSFTTFAAIGIA